MDVKPERHLSSGPTFYKVHAISMASFGVKNELLEGPPRFHQAGESLPPKANYMVWHGFFRVPWAVGWF